MTPPPPPPPPPPGEWAPETEPAGDQAAKDTLSRILGPPEHAGPSPVNELAEATRRLTELVVGRSVPEEELARAADQVKTVVEHLEAAAAPGKAPRRFPDRQGPPQDYFVTSPVIGFANPLAPPVRIWAVRGETSEGETGPGAGEAGEAPADPENLDRLELRGTAYFGYAYEGPPTCVHGGVIAETFDELLGTTNILTGHAGMTGTLTIRYRRPTPLLAPVDLEARLLGVDGRKISVWGGMFHDGELTAEAEGLFIEAGPERMLKIAASNAKAAGDQAMDPQLAKVLQMARSRPSQ